MFISKFSIEDWEGNQNSGLLEEAKDWGAEGIYPAKWFVDLNATLTAAKAFAQLGTIEKSVDWEQDGVAEPA